MPGLHQLFPALPGAHSCGDTLDEVRANLKEAVELMQEELKAAGDEQLNAPQITIEDIVVAPFRT